MERDLLFKGISGEGGEREGGEGGGEEGGGTTGFHVFRSVS